jgi:hypothetical protein
MPVRNLQMLTVAIDEISPILEYYLVIMTIMPLITVSLGLRTIVRS